MVRIGKPLRPEFAAWRYGDRFGTRLRRRIVTGATAGAALAGGIALGGIAVGAFGVVGVSGASFLWLENRPIVRFRPSDGRVRRLNYMSRFLTLLDPTDDETGFRVRAPAGWTPIGIVTGEWHEGDDARRALDAILPWDEHDQRQAEDGTVGRLGNRVPRPPESIPARTPTVETCGLGS